MARIRTIKPEFPQSESMGRVSRDARLLFVLLWTIADDFGRSRASSRMLASLLFPYDEDAFLRIPEWLIELERQSCIKIYAIDGNTYLQIEKWSSHQKIDHPSKSKFPSPPEKIGKSREGNRKLRLGPRTKEGTKDQGGEIAVAIATFDDFWKVCPKRVGRGVAEKAFVKATSTTSPEVLIAAMQRYGASQDGKDVTFTKTPGPWLNGKHWLDELPQNGTGPPSALPTNLAEVQRIEEENRLKMQETPNVH